MIAGLVIFPALWRHSKTAAAAMIFIMHWFIWIFLTFGFLPLTTTSWALAILPGAAWERLGWHLPATPLRRMVSWAPLRYEQVCWA